MIIVHVNIDYINPKYLKQSLVSEYGHALSTTGAERRLKKVARE